MDSLHSLRALAADRWPVVAASVVVFVLAVLLPQLLFALRLSQLPLVGFGLGSNEKRRQAYLAGARGLYVEGYRKFKDGICRIITSKTTPTIIVSPKFLPELKKLPDAVLSMYAAIDESMETKYTQIESSVPIMPHTIKTQLTPALVRLNAILAQEVQEVLDLELPAGRDWAEINIHHVLLRVVAMVSGRVFIGPELCRSEQYLDAAINYTMEVMAAQRAVHEMRPWLRPLLAHRLPQVQALTRRIREADEFLRPVVEQRRRRAAEGKTSNEQADDMLQWLINEQDRFPDKNSQNLAGVQLGLSFAAIHTTSLTATNAFYDLAATPDLITQLRREARQVLAANDGRFSGNAPQSMKMMDSFLKETLRLHPVSMASFQRKALKPFTLSNGQVIPAGVTVEVPAVAISSDPDLFPDPDRFDPLRFFRLSAEGSSSSTDGASAAAKNQFVSVGESSLTFGYGRHACPGRFFAANEIKMILAAAITRYDFKTVDGSGGRYPNIEFAHMSIPDPSKMLLCRKAADV